MNKRIVALIALLAIGNAQAARSTTKLSAQDKKNITNYLDIRTEPLSNDMLNAVQSEDQTSKKINYWKTVKSNAPSYFKQKIVSEKPILKGNKTNDQVIETTLHFWQSVGKNNDAALKYIKNYSKNKK